jgi:hypothetical protein
MDKIKSAEQSAKIAIASVLLNLATRQFDFTSKEDMLVLAALRRSKTSLNEASLEELGDYVRDMNIDQLRGLASNVKGIYHELSYVVVENSDGDDITAEIFPDTNHPGADVILLKDGEAFSEVQLKATDNVSLVEKHFERYPDTEVAATSEVAQKMDDVHDSGFSNEELEKDVGSTFDELTRNTPVGNAEEVMAVSGIISATKESISVLRGEKNFNDASGQTLQDMGVAVSSSLLADLIFA